MTNTAQYTQQLESGDFPLSAEWDIEYSMGDEGPEINDKTLGHLTVWLTEDLGAPVRLWDMTAAQRERVQKRLAALLDDEALDAACESHWERFGQYYEQQGDAA